MTDTITIQLPWPPSMNHYWRSIIVMGICKVTRKRKRRVQVLISAEGRKYRKAVAAAVLEQLARYPRMSGPLAVELHACPPDRRVRDLDNLLKGTLDAMTHAGVWTDDGNLDRIQIERHAPVPGGSLVVSVRPYAEGVQP
jgi:crossover junction endodeoxyribonuclease RusA